MNQQLIFNDDFSFCVEQRCWCFSAQLEGAKIWLFCSRETDRRSEPDDECKLDYEWQAEEWLSQHDVADDGKIYLSN
ncbi:hypothetical protein EDC56_0997 [Sinobacterium caligoides]|uniref:Uncharacterized protein n=1 Tax=Sinobacterium caligoides TaxID=933926 RepID=A0A3N2E0C3_9GAMM|nr:hypothetical protein [Sinobacterium caligoides]ROS05467.1 hypothetical protein EDC56_0997 [Sinobacterium caligoides]